MGNKKVRSHRLLRFSVRPFATPLNAGVRRLLNEVPLVQTVML